MNNMDLLFLLSFHLATDYQKLKKEMLHALIFYKQFS